MVMPDIVSNAGMIPQDTEEAAKLRRWRSEFQQDLKVHLDWCKEKKKSEQFYDGDQLSTEEKTSLRARNQPEVVINLIKPRIDGVIGDFLGKRVMMRAFDRGTQDFETAKHITEALRYIEDQTRFDEQESQVAEDLFIGGVGWYKEHLEFDFLEPEIRISYRSNDDIVVDRRSRRRDLKDAKRLYETVWVEVEDLVELYPEHAAMIRAAADRAPQSLTGDNLPIKGTSYIGDDYAQSSNVGPDTGFDFESFIDPKRKRLRLINIWERVQKRIEFAFHPDFKEGVVELSDLTAEERKTLKNSFPDFQTFVRTRWELNSGMFIANKILEDKQNVREHDSEGKFPFARAVGHITKGDERKPYGMVKQYISPQEEYNKRRSKLLHKLNTNRILAEEGAFAKGSIETARREAARPDGVVLFANGRQVNIDSDQPTQTDLLMLQQANNEIEASGISKEFVGTENAELSGKAINLRQAGGQKMLRAFYAGLRSARRHIFRIVLEDMQQFWTSEKLIRITDDPKAGGVILNQRVSDEQTGETVILNSLKLGKYDIKIDEDLETPNQRKETFQQLANLGGVALKSGEPFPLELLIKASDLPNKDEWLEAIALRKQQQLELQQQQLEIAKLQALAQVPAGAGQNGQ